MHIAAAAAPRSGRYSLRVRIIAWLSPIRVDRNSRLPIRRIVPALISACLAWAVPGQAASGDESACRAHLAAPGFQAQPLPALAQVAFLLSPPLRLPLLPLLPSLPPPSPSSLFL